MMKSDAAKRYLAELGRKYLWWDPVGDESHSENPIFAQAMDFGTFDDIVALEQTVGKKCLAEVMLRAEPAGLAIVPGNSGAAGCRLPRYRMRLLEGIFMPQPFDPKFDVLPAAQRQI
jgi:hypothetical protein